jgi:hypothetical protein
MTARGTSRDYLLRRLREHAPALHARVLAGELSTYAATVKAGLVKPRFTVLVTSADSVAATLRKQLPADVLDEVVRKLSA